jgi:hypothetical protein
MAWETPLELPEPTRNATQHILLQFLRAIPPRSAEDSWSKEECREYRKQHQILLVALVYSKTMNPQCTTWDVIRHWPLEMSNVFIRMLGSWHPGALLLLEKMSRRCGRIYIAITGNFNRQAESNYAALCSQNHHSK